MHLHANWRAIMRRAWSIRLILLAGLLSGAEAALAFADLLPWPPGAAAAVSAAVSMAAFVARIVAQENLKD